MSSYHTAFDAQQIEVLARIMKTIAALPVDVRPINVIDQFGDNVVESLASMFNDPDLLCHPAPMLNGFCM